MSAPTSASRPSIPSRLAVAIGLLSGLRRHDLRAAQSKMSRTFTDHSLPVRLLKFAAWVAAQMLDTIPNAMVTTTFAENVSRTSIWLATENPLSNHPWATDPNAALPKEVEVAVIGAGFTGAACAYHWSKQSGGTMAVLEMNEAATGASGRNEGLVVMGRFFAYVKDTVLDHFNRRLRHLTPEQRGRLASKFASAYVKSAYKNGDLIEQTVKDEGFDCDYAREGWVQGQDFGDEAELDETVRLGIEAGFDDWGKIQPEEVLEKSGMPFETPAGYSKRTASWHPAKWVWSLLTTALKSDNIKMFTNTRVLHVEDQGEHYEIHTNRGAIRAHFVINATESYTAILHPQFQNVLNVIQTQAAYGEPGPQAMKPLVGISCSWGWFGRLGKGVIFGSDGSRIPYRNAGIINPSRFITKFMIGEMRKHFGASRIRVTREWSCTAGFTDDEFPVIGLIDNKRQYIIGGMCGSGSAVHFNGARHIVQQILHLDGPDDYPAEYFSPTRVLDPDNHPWPSLEE